MSHCDFDLQALHLACHTYSLLRMVAADHYLLKDDVAALLENTTKSTKGASTHRTDRTPSWVANCDDRARSNDRSRGMRFPTTAIADDKKQKVGRKIRDQVYEDFAHNWTSPKLLTWTTIPDEDKTAMANRLAAEPINWHWTVTDKRIRDHIGTTAIFCL